VYGRASATRAPARRGSSARHGRSIAHKALDLWSILACRLTWACPTDRRRAWKSNRHHWAQWGRDTPPRAHETNKNSLVRSTRVGGPDDGSLNRTWEVHEQRRLGRPASAMHIPLASRRWLRTAALRLPPPTPQPRRPHGPARLLRPERPPIPRPCTQRRSCSATRPVLPSVFATSAGTRGRAVLPSRRHPVPRAATARTETPGHSCMGRTAINWSMTSSVTAALRAW